ncbi:transposase [Nocardia sp. CA-107356]|uniref:transposase n=1 Tax=Nocardia sp. CA-107356 TaxID=3239972 RepID=UPI003D8F048A
MPGRKGWPLCETEPAQRPPGRAPDGKIEYARLPRPENKSLAEVAKKTGIRAHGAIGRLHQADAPSPESFGATSNCCDTAGTSDLRVRPANRNIARGPDGSLPECWLLAEWATGAPEPTDYRLSTLPASIPLPNLVWLAKIRWRIEHDYRELKDGLGLDHFEGRSWLGWHRHVTLASIAQAICTQLRHTPKAPAPA